VSKIDELIREYCPEGVVFRPIESIAELKRGTSITKKSIKEGDIPVIAGGQKPAYYHNQSNRTGETIVVAGSGAYAGFVTFWTTPIFVSDAFTVAPDSEFVLPKYLFYFLKSKQSTLHDMQRGGGVPHVYTKDVAPMRMPVPPLEVQKEIVNILDKFTQLEAELSAELDARRKQYDYYRNQLLTFDHSVRNIRLAHIADIGTGSRNGNEALPEGKYPLYVRSQEIKAINSYSYDEEAVIIPGEGGVGDIFHYVNGKYDLHQRAYRVHLKDKNFSSKFLYYYMRSYFKKFITKKAVSATVTSIRKPMLMDFEIPVLPLDKQEQIVARLDKFDALTNDVYTSLPAEIKARRKQYEYYRTKLLTFQELAA